MKKRILFLTALLGLAVMTATGGAEATKTTVRLVPDASFGAGVNWNTVLPQYPGGGSHRATYKDFVRLGDGRFIVLDARTYNFLFFDADGKFVKRLWSKGRRNADDLSIYLRPEWLSLWADKYLFVSELGVVRVFDLMGREIRHAVIDHPVDCLIPLSEDRVAVAGWVLRQDLPVRYLAAVVDLDKGTETVVMDSIESRPEKADLFNSPDGTKKVTVSFPHAQIRPFVRPTAEGGFLAGFSNWPEIEVYDRTGKQIRRLIVKTEPAKMEMSLIDAQAKKLMAVEEEVNKRLAGGITTKPKLYAAVGHYPTQTTPYFYNLYIDDSGKLMVFYFPAEGKNPVYQVYSPAGIFLSEVAVETGDYLIPFSPGGAGAVFAGGYLYAMAEKKGAKEPSLQLMKFTMTWTKAGE